MITGYSQPQGVLQAILFFSQALVSVNR